MTLQNKHLWSDYVINRGQHFTEFWKSFITEKNRNICFILGLGFDPRMCHAVESILALGGQGARDCVLIRYDEGDTSPSHRYQELVQANYYKLKEKFENKGNRKISE